jgi:hypothetical protein
LTLFFSLARIRASNATPTHTAIIRGHAGGYRCRLILQAWLPAQRDSMAGTDQEQTALGALALDLRARFWLLTKDIDIYSY